MLQAAFYTLSTLISIYSLLCIIRVFLSWVPQLEYSPFGRILAGICDPFLNWFRRFPFARVGMVDFSPVIALGILSVGSMVFSKLATTGTISAGVIVASLVQVVWSFFSFLLNIFIICLAIRLVFDLMNRYSQSQFWVMLDRFLNPPIAWVTGLFHVNGRKLPSYRVSLILTLVMAVVLRVGIGLGVARLTVWLFSLPI